MLLEAFGLRKRPEPESVGGGDSPEKRVFTSELLSHVEELALYLPSYRLIVDTTAPGEENRIEIDSVEPIPLTLDKGRVTIGNSKDPFLQRSSSISLKGSQLMNAQISATGSISLDGGSISVDGGGSISGLEISSDDSDVLPFEIFDLSVQGESNLNEVIVRIYLPENKKVRLISQNVQTDIITPKAMSNEEKAQYLETVYLPQQEERLKRKVVEKRQKAQEKKEAKEQKAQEKKAKAEEKRAHYLQKAAEKEAKAVEKQSEADTARQQGKIDKALSKEESARDARSDAAQYRRDAESSYREYMQESTELLRDAQRIYDSYMREAEEILSSIPSEMEKVRQRIAFYKNNSSSR